MRVGVLADGAVRPVPGVELDGRAAGARARRGAAAWSSARRRSRRVAADDVRLLPPVDGLTEVWASGVTYERSMDARVEESQTQDVYSPGLRRRAARAVLQVRRLAGGHRRRADRGAARLGGDGARAGARRRRHGRRPRCSATPSATTSPRATSRGRTRSTCPRRRSTPAAARWRPASGRPGRCPTPAALGIEVRVTRGGDHGVRGRRRPPRACTGRCPTWSTTWCGRRTSRTARCSPPAPASCRTWTSRCSRATSSR